MRAAIGWRGIAILRHCRTCRRWRTIGFFKKRATSCATCRPGRLGALHLKARTGYVLTELGRTAIAERVAA